MAREFGTAVRFKSSFGFITPERGGADLFVHFSEIQQAGEGFRQLFPGERVSFERGADRDGRPCALRVRVEEQAVA